MARRAVKRAGSLERQQPERIRGRQLYLQELMQHGRGLAETWTQEQAQAVMQAHGRQYALLTDADRQHYELRARALSAQRRAVLEEELVSLEATVLTSRAQASAMGEESPHRLSACRFTSESFAQLMDQVLASTRTVRAVKELRKLALAPPEPPSPSFLAQLESSMALTKPGRDPPHSWVKPLAKYFVAFESSILRLYVDDTCSDWKFVYATQSPYAVFAVEVQMSDKPYTLVEPAAPNTRNLPYQQPPHVWSFMGQQSVNLATLQRMESVAAVGVFPHCYYPDSSVLATYSEEFLLEDFLHGHFEDPEEKRARKAQGSCGIDRLQI